MLLANIGRKEGKNRILLGKKSYEARKSTPTDLGSRRNARECKSVANTICTNAVVQLAPKSKQVQYKIIFFTKYAFSINNEMIVQHISRRS